MLIVRATRKLLDRIGPPDLDTEQSTTMLGQVRDGVFWNPQVALLVTTERGTVMLWRPTGLEELQVRRVQAPQDSQLDHDLAQAGHVLTRKYLALSAEISRFLVLAP
jgi:hypothetical protein